MKNLFLAFFISSLLFGCGYKASKREDNEGADVTHQNTDTITKHSTAPPAETDSLQKK